MPDPPARGKAAARPGGGRPTGRKIASGLMVKRLTRWRARRLRGTGSTRSPPTMAMTVVPATGPGPTRMAGRAGPAGGIAGDHHRLPGVIDGLAPVIDRIDGELHQHAKADPQAARHRR